MTRKLLACTALAGALSFGAAHAAATTTVNAGGSSLAFPTYAAEYQLYTNGTYTIGTGASAIVVTAPAHPATLFSYAAVGSGAGQKAFLGDDITFFQPGGAGTANPNGYGAGVLTYGTIVGTAVDIGASDATLPTAAYAGAAPYTGLSNPSTGAYGSAASGSAVSGPAIQLPTIGVPVTIAYAYPPRPPVLNLTDNQICGIFSGQINNWHQLNSLMRQTLANGQPNTIHIAYRSDGSGTSFLLTQHLNAVCNSGNSSFPKFPVAITNKFASLFTTVPSNMTGESGSGNVATYLAATPGSMSYLSPDYTSIAPLSANTNPNILVASVSIGNSTTKFVAPTVANTITGLANPGAGATNATPPSTLAAAMNPTNWVPNIPVVTAGYPIVGYTTIDIATCYHNAPNLPSKSGVLVNLMNLSYSNASYQTIIKDNGFAPLVNTAAAPYINAVTNTFLNNVNGYNLNLQNATTCAGLAGR